MLDSLNLTARQRVMIDRAADDVAIDRVERFQTYGPTSFGAFARSGIAPCVMPVAPRFCGTGHADDTPETADNTCRA
jgi:hypothetical protein